jgi:hypothetical protein
MGFDPQILKVFDEHKLSTCKDLLSRISVELLQELDLPFPLLQEIILKVSRKIAPPMLTVPFEALLSRKLNKQWDDTKAPNAYCFRSNSSSIE